MTKNTEDNSPLPKDKNIDSKIAALRVLKDKISKALDAGEARALLEEYRQQVSGIPSDLLPGGLDLSKVEEACDKVIKNIQNQANALYNQESSKLVKADPEEIKVAEDIKNKISRNVKLIRDHLDNEEVKANTGLSAQILADAQAGKELSSEKTDAWAKKFKTQREGDRIAVLRSVEHPTEEEKKAQKEEEERLTHKYGHDHPVVKKYKEEWDERRNELTFERGKLAYRLETQHELMSDSRSKNIVAESLSREGINIEAEKRRVEEYLMKLGMDKKAQSLSVSAKKIIDEDKALKNKVDKIAGISDAQKTASSDSETKAPSPTPKIMNPKSSAKGH
jgi:hypothetical protein